MKDRLFNEFKKLIHQSSGIFLSDDKKSMLINRISKRLISLKIKDYSEYLDLIKKDTTRKELMALINMVSTNTTYFFREKDHFEILNGIIKDYEKKGKERLRIWCAASSSGEEPYTVSMCVYDAVKKPFDDLKILATDINREVLLKAKSRSYSEESVRKLPKQFLEKYFLKDLKNPQNPYVVKTEIADSIIFSRLNLIKIPYPFKGPVDIIFCRNVMIYFDKETRKKIVNEMYKLLNPGGYLFISLSEKLASGSSKFQSMKGSVYRKIL